MRIRIRITRVAWEGLQTNIVMDDDMMIYKGTGEVLDEVDSTYWKENFRLIL